MNRDEYNRAQQKVSRSLIAIILRILSPFQKRKLTEKDYNSLLHALYPPVEEHRRQSAELGRQFYDSERAKHAPGTHEVDLEPYRFEWFAENMAPVKLALMREDTPDSSAQRAALRAVKDVENGGRRTILRAVGTDRRQPLWARVPYEETCAFCVMLCARGPVYHSAETAGWDTDDTTAMQLVGADDQESLKKLMRRFHPGCDCRLVPVFNKKSWPGRSDHLKAKKLWKDSTKGYSGKDALNALRRAVYEGTVDEKTLEAA